MENLFDYNFYRLTEREIEKALNLQETGMGFQILYEHGEKPTDSILTVLTNGEFIVEIEENILTPVLTNFESLSLNFDVFDIPDFANPFIQGTIDVVNKFAKIPKSSSSQQPPFVYRTRNGDEFRRLSAMRNDRRIKTNGEVLAKTYGTTINDLTVVSSGIAAVGRYALPNRIAACYVYQIIPPPGTVVYFGTVTPDFGLCGGGVEVYFPNGCPANSARLIGTISEI